MIDSRVSQSLNRVCDMERLVCVYAVYLNIENVECGLLIQLERTDPNSPGSAPSESVVLFASVCVCACVCLCVCVKEKKQSTREKMTKK